MRTDRMNAAWRLILHMNKASGFSRKTSLRKPKFPDAPAGVRANRYSPLV
jgi:hypothetical protein